MGSSLVPVVADWSSTPMGSHPLRPPGQRRAPRQLVVRRTGSGIGLLHLLHKLDLPAAAVQRKLSQLSFLAELSNLGGQ